MFIDSAKIHIRAGAGGKGCQSVYRDKYTRSGILDGGDGGRGADIVIRSDRNLHTLLDFKYRQHLRGLDGGNGSGKNKTGKNAPALIVRVPCGTIIKDINTGCVLRDLDCDGEEVIAARGGEGGLGNQHKSHVTPQKPGEEKDLLLDLKLIADVGIVGFPNAGKSTLISQISNARPKIAAYPFTTKFPVLGVARFQDKFFVVADIPGLIEGSSQGRGMGDKFLRHIERTKLILHMIDMAACDGRDPLDDYKIINRELKQYNPQVFGKPQVLVANKMDLRGAVLNLARFKKLVKKNIYPVSLLNRQGLEGLIEAIAKKL